MNMIENKLFVGIDPSLNATGITIINNNFDIIDKKLISTKKKDENYDIEKRIIFITSTISNFLENHLKDLKLTLIEGISYGSTGDGAAQLAALNYYIRIFLYQKNIPYKEIPPTTLKKFVTGVGNCKKNLMLKEVYKKWGVDFTDDNICDSYGLARLGQHIFSKMEISNDKICS